MSELSIEAPAEDTPLDPPAKPLYAIQRPWLVGLLAAATWGFYLVFFMYVYARDLKRLGQQTKPWLWFFSPLVAIAMPFAGSNLADKYTAVGRQLGVETTIRGGHYGSIVFVVLAINRVVERFALEVSGLVTLITMPVLGISIARFTAELNTVKRALPDDWFNRAAYSITPGTWIWLVVAFALLAPLWGFVIVDEVQHLSRESLKRGQTWTAAEKTFSVTPRDAWSIAEIGTFSDGTTEAEFSYTDSVYIMVFDESLNNNLKGIGDVRRNEFLSRDDSGECDERRWIEPDTLQRYAELVCTGSVLGSTVTVISTVISSEKRAIEAWGEAYVGPGEDDTSHNLRRFIEDIELLEPEA